MMAELTGPTPKTTDLIAHGMYDYSLRAMDLDPPPGNRGTQRGTKAQTWSCTITSMDAARPLVRALRDNPDEADRDARLRFMALFAHKKNLEPISENPNREIKKKPKPPAEIELDEDAASLI